MGLTPAPETLMEMVERLDRYSAECDAADRAHDAGETGLGPVGDAYYQLMGETAEAWTRISAALKAALEFSRLTDEVMTYPPQFRGQVVIAMQLAEEAHKKFRALVGTKGGER